MQGNTCDDRLPPTSGKLVGTSLRYCIQSMVEKKIPIDRIAYLITSTYLEEDKDLDIILKEYHWSWAGDNIRAEEILRTLWRTGKIYQPRISMQATLYGKDKFKIWHTEKQGVSLLRRCQATSW